MFSASNLVLIVLKLSILFYSSSTLQAIILDSTLIPNTFNLDVSQPQLYATITSGPEIKTKAGHQAQEIDNAPFNLPLHVSTSNSSYTQEIFRNRQRYV